MEIRCFPLQDYLLCSDVNGESYEGENHFENVSIRQNMIIKCLNVIFQ